MTTQDYLRQATRYERMIKNKMSEIARFRDCATSITVQDSSDRVQTSSSKDRMGGIVAKIVDLQREIEQITRERDKIIKNIENLDDVDSYQILYSHYIDGTNLHEIRTIIHCSRTQIYKLHDKAIEEFEQKYGKIYLKKE